jgi:hypothetical protein
VFKKKTSNLWKKRALQKPARDGHSFLTVDIRRILDTKSRILPITFNFMEVLTFSRLHKRESAFLCNAPQFLGEHCFLESSQHLLVCPPGKSNIDEDEYGTLV